MKLGRQIYCKNTGQYNPVWKIVRLNTIMLGEQKMIKTVANTSQESVKTQRTYPQKYPEASV